MKVLFLAHSYPRFASDPVGSFVLRLASALREEGIVVRVVAPCAEGLARIDEYDGIVVERFRYAPRRYENLAYTGMMRSRVGDSWSARLALGGLLGATTLAAAKAARRFGAEILHAHWWFPAGLAASAALTFHDAPLVTTMHGTDLRIAREGRLARRLLAHVVRRSRALTTVSTWLAREARTLVPDVEPMVAPMPVAVSAFRERSEHVRDRLLFVGKLNEQKGIVTLLQAMQRMRRSATLDVVVGVGSDEGPTRRLAASLGLEQRIRWFPLLEQSALAERYRDSTALVVPALDEGLGMTAIEAQLSGTPVVAFASGGLTDIVDHERTGYLVAPGDVAALAGALDRLLEQPDQGSAMGRAGRQHALRHFAPAAVARRYADLYRSIRGRGHH